ncbi:hypothetical protein XM38_045720 [Halomicronema hongdechloris C2206]|uniref:Uncharacterized protein n=1 Tax=Halomicronema hongdechloris C2206 TaxID=1641165 RepID=A0A1Z3HTE2_9CYAN|nr:hypothetical protein [Halomicronema hongdechloris]ASC73601.1 hypothetical protein XM38_045720 [Halomicronema hongdechloris C2206]
MRPLTWGNAENTDAIEAYWQAYRAALPEAVPPEPYLVDRFGDTPALADTLGQLVLAGTKTATCLALWE